MRIGAAITYGPLSDAPEKLHKCPEQIHDKHTHEGREK
jgi:hypothetical protein